MERQTRWIALLLGCCAVRTAGQTLSCEATSLSAGGQLYSGSVAPGNCTLLALALGAGCNASAPFLRVEVWDLIGLASNVTGSYSSARADPLLGMAQTASLAAVYISAGTWQIKPPQAVFDEMGYELLRHYMAVQQNISAALNGTWYYLCAQQQALCS